MTTKSYMREHYGHLLESAEGKAERLTLDANEAVCRMMDEAGLSKAALAEKMGVSKAYITQLLSGSRNMTLRTLATAAFHCGKQIKIDYEQIGRKPEEKQRSEPAYYGFYQTMWKRYGKVIEQALGTVHESKSARDIEWNPDSLMKIHAGTSSEWLPPSWQVAVQECSGVYEE